VDDQFLRDVRRDPSPEFADRLKEKLDRQGSPRPAFRPAGMGFRLAPTLSVALAAVVVVMIFTIPSVRASAQAFLDLFRVRNFAAVPVNEARIAQLENGNLDLKSLIGDHIEAIKEPGKPVLYPDPQSAGAAAGIVLRTPATLPAGLVADSIFVRGEGQARMTVATAKLAEILTSLGLDDVKVPQNLDGAKVDLRMPAAVSIGYRSEKSRVELIEAHSPEVTLPPGADLAQIGEIGLRIAGMSAADARRFASSIDWHSTLLVPVPTNVSSFREVSVGAGKGLLITTTGESRRADGKRRRPGALLMWAEGDMVYALAGNLDDLSLLQMANSMR